MLRAPLVILLVFAALAAPASAAVAPGVLSSDAADGPIAAYGNTVAWSRWDDASNGYRLVVSQDGVTRTTDVPASVEPFRLSAGPGPTGLTWLLWSRCDRPAEDQLATDCDIEGYDVSARALKSFPFAAKAEVVETAPSIWRDRMVYVTGGTGETAARTGRAQVHISGLDGTGDRVVAAALPPSTCSMSIYGTCAPTASSSVAATALHDDRLAVASRISTTADEVGICGWSNVRLLDLATGAARQLDEAVCGLSGATLTDVTFDNAGGLWWRQGCGGDTSACEGGKAGPFRLTRAGIQRLATSAGGRLAGFAVAGTTPVIAERAPFTRRECYPAGQPAPHRCGTITASAAPAFEAVRTRDAFVPPPGYLTVRHGASLRLVKPPATVGCTRGGDIRPRAGAELWAGMLWVKGKRVVRGTAIRVSARSGRRVVRGTIHRAAKGRESQMTVTLDLGSPRRACGRTWRLTYRPPGRRAATYTVRVGRP